MLRYQPEIGAGLDTPLVRYLTLPVVPVQLGFDPRLQLLHADDATGGDRGRGPQPGRRRRSTSRPTGSISLSRALRMLRRPAVGIPRPLFEPVIEPARRRRRAARRRGAPAALRPRGRQHEAARGGGLRATLRRRRRCARLRREDAGSADRARAPPGLDRRPPDREPGVSARPGVAPISPEAVSDFLRELRGGVESGLDPLAAAQRAADSLPAQFRDALEAIVRRAAGRLPRGRVGLRRAVRRGGLPDLRVPLQRLVAGRGRGRRATSPPTGGRCSSPTTPGRSSPSTRRWRRWRS